jgi:hypothetical protein
MFINIEYPIRVFVANIIILNFVLKLIPVFFK